MGEWVPMDGGRRQYNTRTGETRYTQTVSATGAPCPECQAGEAARRAIRKHEAAFHALAESSDSTSEEKL